VGVGVGGGGVGRTGVGVAVGADTVVPVTMFEYGPSQLTLTARIRYE
jgi:hypothetical protein